MVSTRKTLCFLACTFLLLNSSIAQDYGAYEADLGVKNGRLHVLNDTLISNGLAYQASAKTDIQFLLNHVFIKMDSCANDSSNESCYTFFASDDLQVEQMSFNAFVEEDVAGEDLAIRYFDALDMDPDLADLDVLFEVAILPALEEQLKSSSLQLVDLDLEFMRCYFKVKRPFRSEEITVLFAGQDTFSMHQKRKMFAGLEGALWDDLEIRHKIEDYFYMIDYDLTISFNDPTIYVLPSRLGKIVVHTNKLDDVDRILYHVLPTKVFRKYNQLSKDPIFQPGDGDKQRLILNLYKDLDIAPKELPFLVMNELKYQQLQIAQFDYFAKFGAITDKEKKGIKDIQIADALQAILVNQMSQETQDSSEIQPATPMASEDGFVNENDYTTDPQNEFEGRKKRKKRKNYNNRKNQNYFGVSGAWIIGDVFDISALIQRKLSNKTNVSAQIGYVQSQYNSAQNGVYITGSIYTDYFLFKQLKKRVSLQLTGGTTFADSREFQDQEFAERRNGAKARIDLEWFRDLEGHLLRSFVAYEQKNVVLESSGETNIITFENNISYGEFGFVHYFRKLSAQYSNRLQIEPRIRYGYVHEADTVSNYVSTSCTINFNQSLPRGFAIDLQGHFQLHTDRTPFYDQAALRNSQIRGFKDDQVIAQRLYGGQAEVWIPFPTFGKNKDSKLNHYFKKHLRFAAFSDAIYFSKSTEIEDNWFWSPGFGLRYLVYPAQLNFDFAFPQTSIFSDKKGRFSLNLKMNYPF